jgi:DNA-binding MarR family transcriptional regulator
MKKQRPVNPALLYALISMTFDMAAQTKALIAGVLTELNLTHSLANALWLMEPDGPAPNMSELADRLHCDRSTITFIADRLEELDLINRKVDPANRRVKTLVLTAKGRRVRQRLVAEMSTQTPLAKLSEEERQQLHALFTKAALAARPSYPMRIEQEAGPMLDRPTRR